MINIDLYHCAGLLLSSVSLRHIYAEGHLSSPISHIYHDRPRRNHSWMCCSCPAVSVCVLLRESVFAMVYWGDCANCGAGKNSDKMKNTLNSHKQARPIPPHITHPLPHQSEINNRICTTCYLSLNKHALQTATQPLSQPTTVSALDTLSVVAAVHASTPTSINSTPLLRNDRV